MIDNAPNQPNPAAVFLNERDLSQRYNISVKTLRAWRFRHIGPPYLKLGGSVRYRLADLERWETSHIREAEPANA